MDNLSDESDQDYKYEDNVEALPVDQERSATLSRLSDMFRQHFDDEIIACVAANFGWNEQKSLMALLTLAADNTLPEESPNKQSVGNSSVSQKNGMHDELTANEATVKLVDCGGTSIILEPPDKKEIRGDSDKCDSVSVNNEKCTSDNTGKVVRNSLLCADLLCNSVSVGKNKLCESSVTHSCITKKSENATRKSKSDSDITTHSLHKIGTLAVGEHSVQLPDPAAMYYRAELLPAAGTLRKLKLPTRKLKVMRQKDKVGMALGQSATCAVRQAQLTSLRSKVSSKCRKDCVSFSPKGLLGKKIDRIANSIIDGKKIMILMRGLPGSGKSTLAKYLVQSTLVGDPHKHIYSTDNFFVAYGKGKYKFEPRFLKAAHTWNVKNVTDAAEKGVTPIVIDNTNLEEFEMIPYATIALNYGFQLEFLEPDTHWRYIVTECAKRSIHNIPANSVANMMRRFDRTITVSQLLNRHHVQRDLVHYLQPHCRASKLSNPRKRRLKRNGPVKLQKPSLMGSKTDSLNRVKSRDDVSGCSADDTLDGQQHTGADSTANKLADTVVIKVDSITDSYGESRPNFATDYIQHSVAKPSYVSETETCNYVSGIENGITSHSNEYVLVKDNGIVFQKSHNIWEWLSLQPLIQSNNPQPTLKSERRCKSSNTMEKLVDCDSAQLCFNIMRQESSLIKAMDSEEAPEINLPNYSAECLSNSLNKEHDCVQTEHNDSNLGNRKEQVCIEQPENVSWISHKVSENGLKDPAGSNHVMWDLKHGDVWNYEESKPSVNSSDDRECTFPKPPRKGKKRIPVKDFIEESLHHLSSATNSSLTELPQWDTVEDPVTSWENPPAQGNLLKSEGDKNLLTDVIDTNKTSPTPQPQRLLAAEPQFQRLPSHSPRRRALNRQQVPESRTDLSTGSSKRNLHSDNFEESHEAIKSPEEPDAQSTIPNDIKSEIEYVGDCCVTHHKQGINDTGCNNDKIRRVESKEDGTNTHYTDFLMLQKINDGDICTDSKIVLPRKIVPQKEIAGSLMSTVRPIGKKLLLDKSSMTEHEENLATFPETGFKELIRVFPAIPLVDLTEIFEKCNRDVNWTVDVLLETDYKNTEESVSDQPLYARGALDPLSLSVPQSVGVDNLRRMSPGVEVVDKNEEKSDEVPVKMWTPQRTAKKEKNVTPSILAQELKQQLEKNIVLNKECYSDHVQRIRKMRHGELLDMGELTVSSEVGSEEISEGYSLAMPEDGHNAVGHVASTTDSPTKDAVDSGIQTGDAYIDVKLTEEFVSQLHELFGGSPHLSHTANSSSIIKLPITVALQIHYYLIKHEEDEFVANQLKTIQEDEEFARKLEEKRVISQKEAVPNLQEIMDMEMALALYKASKKQWHDETTETLALKLRKSMLCEMFPRLNKDLILNVFETSEQSMDDTLAILTAMTGDLATEITTSQEALAERSGQLLQAATTTLQEDSDVEDCASTDIQDDSILAIVKRYREEASRHHTLRNECYCKAQQAYQKGMHSVASYYSQIAQQHESCSKEASGRVRRAVEAAAPSSLQLDLHGLSVREAICVLDSFLDAHIRQLQWATPSRVHLEVITGRGNKSPHHRPRIRPAVLQRINQRCLRYEELNEGIFRVTVNRNSGVSK